MHNLQVQVGFAGTIARPSSLTIEMMKTMRNNSQHKTKREKEALIWDVHIARCAKHGATYVSW